MKEQPETLAFILGVIAAMRAGNELLFLPPSLYRRVEKLAADEHIDLPAWVRRQERIPVAA